MILAKNSLIENRQFRDHSRSNLTLRVPVGCVFFIDYGPYEYPNFEIDLTCASVSGQGSMIRLAPVSDGF